MRILSTTNIDFIGKRYPAFALSGLLILVGIASLVLHGGPNLGIDFAGGSQIVVRFAEMPPVGDVRSALAGVGLSAATIQEFEAASNELLIRTPGVTENEQIDAAVTAVSAALDSLEAGGQTGYDLNTVGRDTLLALLLERNPKGYDLDADLDNAESFYRTEIEKVLAARAEAGLFRDWSGVEAAGGDTAVVAVLRDNSHLGGYAIVNSESVGPQVGRDLRNQTMQAIVFALVGMLAYIWYRFEFKFGVGAVIALVHDVTLALGAFSLTNREFNLPVVAAFLTIVGYSLNDTVVVFDRIRENNTLLRRMSRFDRFNKSLNQTLSRTLLTSATTLIVVASLFLFGGPVINDFSFALLVGIMVGTYSSLFVASPVVYMWQEWEAARRR